MIQSASAVYVMWFNYCDDWTEWSPSGFGVTYNTTTAVHAQGSKALALSYTGAGYAYSNLTLTNSTMDDNSSNRCWGFWYRSESDGAVPADYMKWMLDQANWFGFYQSGARAWNWEIVISGTGYGAHFIQSLAADTWYYFECNYTTGTPGTWRIFIDGVNKYEYGGSMAFYPISFQYAFYQSNTGESLYLDGLRVSDTNEYPPTYPPEPPGPDEEFKPLVNFLAILGIIGLACMICGPTYGLYQMKNGEYVTGLQSIVIFSILGLGLFLGWLGHFG